MDYFPEIELVAPHYPDDFYPELLFIPKKSYSSLGLGIGFWLGIALFAMVLALVILCIILYIRTHITVPLPPGVAVDLELQPAGVDPALQPAGVDPALRHNMPLFHYSSASALTQMPHSEEICVLCQEELIDGDSMSMIPPCRHAFHTSCIDLYMDAATICPCCRSTITLDSTPDPTTTTSL